MKSSGMGGIPPTRFANHAPISLVFSYVIIRGKCCRHLRIIALPPATDIDLITIPTALSCKVASAAMSTSATMTASILGQLGLGLVGPFLVNRLWAVRDVMIRITVIETIINPMLLWNIPLIQYIQSIE